MSSAPRAEEAAVQIERALFEIKKVIVGQERTVERLMASLLARGHCLLEGVPGLAKTLAVETLATVAGGTFARVQFTPDLLPADIVGTRIYRASTEQFDVELGPIFANFVLADEINRAPAKVQSALLEVMAERQVSIGGTSYQVPRPFLVLATQNPIESEGVYPLPEAQRDRLLMKLVLGYPSPAEEAQIVQRMGVSPPEAQPALQVEQLAELQSAADAVFVDRGVIDYAVSLVLATRDPGVYELTELDELIEYGASPRASLGLIAGGRALALMRGRSYVLPQDVFDVAPDVLRHRLVLSYEALARGLVIDQILARILSTVPAPRVTPGQPTRPSAPAHPFDTTDPISGQTGQTGQMSPPPVPERPFDAADPIPASAGPPPPSPTAESAFAPAAPEIAPPQTVAAGPPPRTAPVNRLAPSPTEALAQRPAGDLDDELPAYVRPEDPTLPGGS